MMEMLEDINWFFVMLFWIPISIGIWKAWTGSSSMGDWRFRIIAIIGMFFMITFIVARSDN